MMLNYPIYVVMMPVCRWWSLAIIIIPEGRHVEMSKNYPTYVVVTPRCVERGRQTGHGVAP